MRILQWAKQAIQFVFDPDIYCLMELAIRNLHKGRCVAGHVSDLEKTRAKAVNGR